MSGSPIYLDGRLIGAYAYGWSYGKDPIAGVTPISNMLKGWIGPDVRMPFPSHRRFPRRRVSTPRRSTATRASERRDAFWALSELTRKRGEVQACDALAAGPCATPLLVGGVTAPMASMLREHLSPLGLEVLEAASGLQRAQRAGSPGLRATAARSPVTLIRGDIQATAVGTVTHVAGKRAVAFGHPMLDAGEVGLPTATSRVIHVLASERSSFKMAEAIKLSVP